MLVGEGVGLAVAVCVPVTEGEGVEDAVMVGVRVGVAVGLTVQAGAIRWNSQRGRWRSWGMPGKEVGQVPLSSLSCPPEVPMGR